MLGRHVHGAKRGPDKRFLPDLQQPALVYPIRYNGADFTDARRRFLADHRPEDIAEWLDLLIWVDSLYRRLHLLQGRNTRLPTANSLSPP